MGFPFNSEGLMIPKTLLLLLIIIDLIYFSITILLFYLGLYPSYERPQPPSWEDIQLVFDITPAKFNQASPPSMIKSQLAVLNFSTMKQTRWSSLEDGDGDDDKEETMCIVCLGSLEGEDEVRELGNCIHVFHKECLDKWVDIGHHTCPMCRSLLLPSKSCKGNRWSLFGTMVKLW
ncbi:putative chromatin regulator PHD family [Dioscorea sansibarensis]